MNKSLAIVLAILGIFGGLCYQGQKASVGKMETKFRENAGQVASPRALRSMRPNSASDVAVTAIQGIDQMPDGEAKDEALQQAADQIPDANIIEVLQKLVGDQGFAARNLREMLVQRWASSNPAAAASWAVSESEKQPELMGVVATVWAENDLENARKWVNALAAGEGKTDAVMGLGYEAARTQPLVAIEAASQLEPGEQRDALLVHAAMQWAGDNTDQAMEWVKGLPEDELQQSLAAAVAISVAEKDGAAAAKFLTDILKSDAELESAAVAVVQRWAQTDPSAAAAWIEEFPDTPARLEAISNLMTLWVAQDNAAAWQWATQQNEPEKIVALKAYNLARAQTPVQ